VIFVDGMTHRLTIWGDGVSAHLVSDTSVAELKEFAGYIRMPLYWFQPLPVPHFELSPMWRRRAIKVGAVDCAGEDRRERYLEALRRFLELHPGLVNEPVAHLLVARARRTARARG